MDVETHRGRSRADFDVPLTPEQVLDRLRDEVPQHPRFRLVDADPAHADLVARFGAGAWGGRIHLRLVGLSATSTMVVAEWRPRLAGARRADGQGERDLEALAALLRP